MQLEGEWKINRVLDVRAGRQGREYLVRWQEFPHFGDTWEPELAPRCWPAESQDL